jgi:hypothetical protein
MPEYKLIVDESGAKILDQDAQVINLEAALPLVDALRGSYEPPAVVYFMHHQSSNLYKIGMTTQSVSSRLSQIRYEEDARDIVVVHTIACDKASQASDLEFAFHSMHGRWRAYGEWFSMHQSDIEVIKTLKTFIYAVNRVMRKWKPTLEGYGRTEFSVREEAIYRAFEVELTKRIAQKDREIDEEVWHFNNLLDRYNGLENQIETLIKQRDDLASQILASQNRIEELENSVF